MTDFTIPELSAINAALILYKASLEKTDLSKVSAKEESLLVTIQAATETALDKIGSQVRMRGGIY